MKVKKSLICLLLFFSVSGWALVLRAQNKAEATAAVKEWKRYELKNSPLSVLLPTAPEEKLEEQTLESGMAVKTYIYAANTKQGSYVITHAILDEAAGKWPESAVESFYNGVWQGISEAFESEFAKEGISLKANLLEKRKTMFSGYDGRELSFLLGPLKGHVKMTLIGHQAFTAMSVREEGLAIDDQERFFASIKINLPPIKQ